MTTSLQQFRAGDRNAFDLVVAEYAGPAYAVAVKVLGEASAAEDAVQEAMVRVWRAADRFDPARGNERTWVLSVVRNQAIDLLRRRRPERSIDEAPSVYAIEDGEDVWSAVAESVTGTVIREAVAQLPGEQRDTIALAYFEGLRPVEIARRTGIPEGTVRSRLRLGLKRLRELVPADVEAR